MKQILLTCLVAICFCKPAKADFELFFDAPSYSFNVGDFIDVDLILREIPPPPGPGPSDPDSFTFGLTEINLTVRLVDPSVARFTAATFNPGLDDGDDFTGGINDAVFAFRRTSNTRTAAETDSSLQATLGRFTLQALSAGSSLLEVGVHPGAGTAELQFGGAGLGGTSFDLNGVSPSPFLSSTITASDSLTAVPEPTSLVLAGLAGAGAFCNRRVRGLIRRKKQAI